MATTSTLPTRRQQQLAALAKARRAHRGGVRAARQAALRATHAQLRAEVAEQHRQRRTAAKQACRAAMPDLFQGLH